MSEWVKRVGQEWPEGQQMMEAVRVMAKEAWSRRMVLGSKGAVSKWRWVIQRLMTVVTVKALGDWHEEKKVDMEDESKGEDTPRWRAAAARVRLRGSGRKEGEKARGKLALEDRCRIGLEIAKSVAG